MGKSAVPGIHRGRESLIGAAGRRLEAGRQIENRFNTIVAPLPHSKRCVFIELWISPKGAIPGTREPFTAPEANGRVVFEQHLGEG